MRTLLHVVAAAATLAAAPVSAELHLWVGDNGSDFSDSSWQTFNSQIFGGSRTIPGAGDLAVFNNEDHTGPLGSPAPAINLTSNATVDSLRLSNGGSVAHTSGTLTISNAVGADVGLWIGEFGPTLSSYTLDGGAIEVLDTTPDGSITPDGLQIGRGGPGEFVFNSGTVNMTNLGGTIIGLDADATWTQSGGVFNANKVDIGVFQSPTATVSLSGAATWALSDGLLLADASSQFPNAISANLNLTGSNVSLQTNGLIVREKGNLNFTADAGGISPIVHTGGLFEIAGAGGAFPGLSVDLSSYTPTDDTLTLIDGFSIPAGQFDSLAEGSTVPGAAGRVITYRGGDGFDISLVPADQYVPPNPDPTRPNAAVARWSMDLNPNAPGPFAEGNPKVLDVRLGTDEGTISVRADTPAEVENLFFFSADNGHTVTTSSDVPPTGMFINGNNAGAASYDAGTTLPAVASEGALFFPQDVYGNELAFTESFTVETFFKTSEGLDVQQILIQGEAFARFGLTMNEDAGGLRFFVNDGTTIETIDIGGTTGEGAANYADGEWHYLVASFEVGAGANSTGLLTLAIADEDGTTALVTRDLPETFGGLPVGNDGNLFIGTENFGLDVGGDGPRRFDGLLDEIQFSAGVVTAGNLLGAVAEGDYNGDGRVDAADYTVWRDGGAGAVPGQLGYELWAANYGRVFGPSSTNAVPEPAALLLLALTTVSFLARSGR
ncbi:hypothetical protein MalM25_17120 [Planctomycetes bacterium MalM25]|nr:hypothetical protein MalM25_17120 [Planctomycetes bacterium MalM25]